MIEYKIYYVSRLCFSVRSIAHNGWVFVSGFALHNAQFKAQMLMAKLAKIPCYMKCGKL